MQNHFITNYITPCVQKLYSDDPTLFAHNLSERCISFRFAHYLQNQFDDLAEYNVFVDCDYNSHIIFEDGEWKRRHGKPLRDRDENNNSEKVTGRFIDIIVHKRAENENPDSWSDLICFELKKWNNHTSDRNEKDRNNLERLTTDFGYQYGFHLIFGRTIEGVTIEVFENGTSAGEPIYLF